MFPICARTYLRLPVGEGDPVLERNFNVCPQWVGGGRIIYGQFAPSHLLVRYDFQRPATGSMWRASRQQSAASAIPARPSHT